MRVVPGWRFGTLALYVATSPERHRLPRVRVVAEALERVALDAMGASR